MDRNAWQWCLLVSSLAIGCSQGSNPQDYKSYKELTKNDAVAKTNDVKTDQTADSATTDTATPEVAVQSMDAPDPAFEEAPASALAPANVVDGTSAAAVLNAFPSSPTTPAATEKPPAAVVPAATVTAEPKPGGIQVLVPHREFKVEGPQNALRVSYDDLDLLKVLNMEPVPEDAVAHFPSWLKALDGQRLRVRGFMYPTFQATGIDQFVLARDNQICCFGRNPKVYDLVSVQMRDGVTTDYIQNRPFDVVGTFRIDLVAEGGKPMGLYWLEDSVVINK
ncbi:MAG TPA: hypothetical protein VFG20_09005 [Planctomycetaceae bacterium]|nr:hypothetical protein [Planctomycetaceae bacterium]